MSDLYGEILNSSNINTILEHYGINIHKNKCLCPFHNDKHPSMSIEENRSIAKCFSCGAGGNSISFIQKYENEINHNSISVRQAMQKAIDIQGLNIVIPNNTEVHLTEEQKKLQKATNILKDVVSLNEKNINANNNESNNALKYLENRKISLDTIKHFHIGYTPTDKTYTTSVLNKKYEIQELIDLGISKVNDNKQYSDIFYGRIMIPIFDTNGNPVGFGARTLNDNIKPKYLNTKANNIFNKSKLLFNYHQAKSYARNDEIIVVEGYMDVISAKQMKMDNVVGIMGTALTKEHIKLFKKLNCEVTLALDNDDAGKEAMIRVIPELLNEKIKVSVLDIDKLGNYKDFGDLQIADFQRKDIYQTKISAFTFLMQQKYAKNIELTVENIHNIHNKMWKEGLLKNTKDVLNFKEYILNNTKFTSDEVDKIISPTNINYDKNNRVNRYKDIYFYYYIVGLIKNYAIKHQDTILLKYMESGKLTQEILSESINDSKYLKDDGLNINLVGYIQEFLFNTNDYINFKNDKSLLLDNLLNNVKSFDSKGNIVNIELSIKQKELVISQYNDSFDNSVKEYIENNSDEFEELFIANSNSQFEKLFPKTYKEAFKDQAVSRFKNYGVMEAVRYGLAYNEDMKPVMSRQFVNNNKYKTLLVFNNNNNILKLSSENIKKEEKEPEKNIEQTVEKQVSKEKQDVSIFLKLTGEEKETSKGMYLPINSEKAVFVPKQLYKKLDNQQVELTNYRAGKAIMSEYDINPIEQTKKWISRLSLEDFYHKYFNLYEIKTEKEAVMV